MSMTMTKTLNTPPGGYLIFKNDVWAGSIPTDWPSRPNLENLHALRQGVGGRPHTGRFLVIPMGRFHVRPQIRGQTGAWRPHILVGGTGGT